MRDWEDAMQGGRMRRAEQRMDEEEKQPIERGATSQPQKSTDETSEVSCMIFSSWIGLEKKFNPK